jgi:hypothetical protein
MNNLTEPVNLGEKPLQTVNQTVHLGIIELEYLLFLSPEFNIRLYDKNSESDYYCFPPPKSEYFFQQHWVSEYFFRKKP